MLITTWLLFCLLSLLPNTVETSNNSAITKAFPQLMVYFPDIAETTPNLTYAYTYGRQSFEKCCALAVYRSLIQTDNGSIKLATPSFIGPDLNHFRNGQFPCGASYDDSKSGAPPVIVTYGWCCSRCPGWQRSEGTRLNQWVLPVFGFIVPAMVFCLAIPRRRKLEIWEGLFNVPLNAVASAPRTPFIAIAAVVLVTIDTIAWLAAIFALAGPILTSGIYEAMLDSRILAYLQERMKKGKLSIRQRCQLMYIVLIGNLDMMAVPHDSDEHDTTWNHLNGPSGLLEGLAIDNHHTVDPYSLESTKTRLRTILANQYSFGVTVGAPVVFFCGGFVYTFIDNYSHLGDNNTGHALAFGMWYMIVPHCSILSGLLLAGNNPNALEGIVGRATANQDGLKWGFLAWAYDSRYHPAWIWDRGRSKRLWALRCCQQGSRTPDGLQELLSMSFSDWIKIAVSAGSLVIIPSVLAFLTSYHTPKIGMSCRSMTFLLYMLSQLWLIVLWVRNIESSSLNDKGVPETPVTRSLWARNPRSANWRAYLWYPQTLIACSISIFTGIGGTLMQIIGVFRNCLCAIPVSSWGRSRFDTEFVISTNSAEAIRQASTFWKVTGAIAITFLGIMSLVGWWSQKRLRYQFKLMISGVDQNADIPRRGPAKGGPAEPDRVSPQLKAALTDPSGGPPS